MRTRKEKRGYIFLVHNYTGDGTMVTSPTNLHGQRLAVGSGLNKVSKDSELKNRYPIYAKYPNADVIGNSCESNN